MIRSTDWMRYRGDGRTPAGDTALTRGEPGRYLADDALVTAVNTALAVEQPLLVTGEAGTGKTMLAWSIAAELGLGPVLDFHTRSDHQARDTLYDVDHLLRFYHAQTGDARAGDMESYVRWQALGEAIRSPVQRVVLIDEVDKAPRDFPNDLLDEIDRMEFRVPELGQSFAATTRPIVIVTSNSERQLPDPFLRRCIFHRIAFPDAGRLRAILHERLRHLRVADRLVDVAVDRFEQLRGLAGWEKHPSTAELLAWVRVLVAAGVDPDALDRTPLAALPFRGALAKTEQDQLVFERAAD
ncbi:MAG: AAA family ATPase [Vicinamibacterales bacterium]